MSLINIKALTKDFIQGEVIVHALQGIDFTIKKGEFTALVGPSGSGKSTLLHCLGALDKPTTGKIILNNQPLDELKKNQLADFRLREIGFVFQAYNLIPVLTAYENVEYILLLQGIEKEDRRKRVFEMFKEMDMQDLLDRHPSKMSGGQQQRVAVARALISNPDVVLADEPTANLDSQNAELLLDIMLKMSQARQTTFLFSTHDERVMRKAKRIISLRDGKVESDEEKTASDKNSLVEK